MGWRGTLRAMETAARRAAREAERHERALEKQRARDEAGYEVARYETLVETLKTVHVEATDPWNWEELASRPEPQPPERSSEREATARAARDAYVPGILARTFRREKRQRSQLARAVAEGRAADEAAYQWHASHTKTSRRIGTRLRSSRAESSRAKLTPMSRSCGNPVPSRTSRCSDHP